MARSAGAVVQVERLRDQVYQLIRDDLKSGAFDPGQRLLEVELAERYGVSRTPVREALFQLSRDGLLSGAEQGYIAPIYTRKDIFDRLEVKRLLGPKVVEHVVACAKPLQIRKLSKFLEQSKAAHAAGNVAAFNTAGQQYRVFYYSICDNQILARAALLLDDQFELTLNRIHERADNRALSIAHNQKLLAAIAAHDRSAAVAEFDAFHDFLATYYDANAPFT
jgi:DNA-binding GntR family transcriptional regulator